MKVVGAQALVAALDILEAGELGAPSGAGS
jgi:hypothetical protein